MSPNNESVVITGTGVVSPVGIGVDSFWQALLNGQSGVRVREGFEETEWPLKIAAPIDPFDGRKYIKPRKAIKMMCRPIQFGYASAQMAVEQAGLLETRSDPDRTGTLFGSEMFFVDPRDVAEIFSKCVTDGKFEHEDWGDYVMRDIQPLWMLKYLPNMVASHVSIAFDARGPNNSICQGAVSGLLAIIEACDLIRRGTVDTMIVGGTGSLMTLNGVLYRGMDNLSSRIDEPERASRPFERDRDGMVAGEGAGAIVIERESTARDRGATIIARINGYSRTFCRRDDSRFSDVVAGNFRSALKMAEMPVDAVGHVNAHAEGSITDDSGEAVAIESVLGQVPVVANKSNLGNLGPGSSLVETVATVCSVEKGTVPPTLNFENADPDCPVNVRSSAVECKQAGAVKSSISRTGQIAAVVFAEA